MSINPQVKAKWVAALRSGTYRQTTGQLTDGDRYCCLGVLCEISKLGEWDDTEEGIAYSAGGEMDEGTPPHKVCDWAGFSSEGAASARVPRVSIDGEVASLDEHNDAGHSFRLIADAIEAEL